MTPSQRDLARHALGLPNPQRRTSRNRYLIPKDGPDYVQWLEMIDNGEALLVSPPTSSLACFALTIKGGQLAIREREQLDPADFPEMRVRV